jgi:hypothetical protein
MNLIDTYGAKTGRTVKENGSFVNVADAVGGANIFGYATSGNLTTLVDTNKDIEADLLINNVIKMTIGGKDYIRKIADQTADTFTFATLPVGEAEIDTLTITAGAGASGNITVTLNGVDFVVAVVAEDTASDVAGKIRGETMAGWTITGATDTAIFTADSNFVSSTPVITDTGDTGVVGAFIVTNAGVDPVPVVAGVAYGLTNLTANIPS